jgi:hypothetical protein
MTLFDDESSRKKLGTMQPIEVMFDDGRNILPLAYYHLTDVPLGGRLRVTFERLDDLPIDETWQLDDPEPE